MLCDPAFGRRLFVVVFDVTKDVRYRRRSGTLRGCNLIDIPGFVGFPRDALFTTLGIPQEVITCIITSTILVAILLLIAFCLLACNQRRCRVKSWVSIANLVAVQKFPWPLQWDLVFVPFRVYPTSSKPPLALSPARNYFFTSSAAPCALLLPARVKRIAC